MMRHKIAYIMSRFPHLTETFILREMTTLAQGDWDIDLFPLVFQKETVVHAESKVWFDRVLTPIIFDLIKANLRVLIRSPKIYFLALLETLSGNIPSIKFLLRSIYLFPKAVWMAEIMQARGVRHIHVHYATHPALTAWIINKISGISYSITVHAHDIFVDKTMLSEKVRDAKAIVAISDFNRRFLIDYLGSWVQEKISVIHCGIELDKYMVSPIPTKDFSKKSIEILSIGSLQPYKGYSHLLDACVILRSRQVSFRCRIVGGGELRKKLEMKIKTLDLMDYVELLGPKRQDEVSDLLSGADCYVQPSVITSAGKMEGIPVAIMEAMASGLPVIATNISGVPELVRDGITGFLVQPENPVELADAILKIIADPVYAGLMARNGREFVQSDFNLSKTASELSGLLRMLIGV